MVTEQTRHDFERARHRAFFHDVLAHLGRRPNDLIPYHEVRRRFSPEGESYRGLQTVPINQIIGSMDRYQDFDRAFLPRQRHTAGRWMNVDRAYYQDVTLPPIQLYKVGDVYFVKDGNHRVSVAREKGVEFIDAEVIEGHIRVPVYASMRPTELLLQVEYAEFLRRTGIDKVRPDHDIRPTELGRYDEIWEHIQNHQRWLSSIWHRPASVAEAVADWYDYIYAPIIHIANKTGILDSFPRRTEADIYLWVMRHRRDFEEREGREIGPVDSARDYAKVIAAQRSPGGRLRRGLRTLGRTLFRVLDPSDATTCYPTPRMLPPTTITTNPQLATDGTFPGTTTAPPEPSGAMRDSDDQSRTIPDSDQTD